MSLLLGVSRPDAVTFAIASVIVLAGGLGVVLNRNPVHAALSLVATLGGIAVLFLAQRADFLAAVQVIVYGGAIVVLFLFVIMLLGVDRTEIFGRDPLPLQRILAVLLGAAGLAAILVLAHVTWVTGAHSTAGVAQSSTTPNVTLLADSIFTSYLLPFEATAALLVIAVVAAVLLARRRHDPGQEGSGSSNEASSPANRGTEPNASPAANRPEKESAAPATTKGARS